MQIIIVDHRRGTTRRFDTARMRAGLVSAGVGCTAFLFAALLIVGGWKLHGWLVPPRVEVVDIGTMDTAEHKQEIDELRRRIHDESAAFARRIATLQAHVARIDAAGERMTRLANLDEGEFDFREAPALGGPIAEEGDAPELDQLLDELDTLEARVRSRSRQLSVLEDMLVDAQAREASRPEGRPVSSGYISSSYGRRTDPFTGRPASHYGLDFAARPGTDVSAVGSGIVEFAGFRRAYGHMVEINHGNGYTTRYGHNSKLLVRAGERVTRGQVIAEVGASGRATGPHLHFEVWQNGETVNPSKYVQAAR